MDILYFINRVTVVFTRTAMIQVFVKDCRDLQFLSRINARCCVAERANILLNFNLQNLVVAETAYLGIPLMTFHCLSLSPWNPVSLSSWNKIDLFTALGPQRSNWCLLSNTSLYNKSSWRFVRHIESDLLPVICIVFEQTIKTAPRTDLSNLVSRVLSQPRESTLVTARHVSMYTNKIRTGGGSLTYSCQHCLWRWKLRCCLSKLCFRDPAWPVLQSYIFS